MAGATAGRHHGDVPHTRKPEDRDPRRASGHPPPDERASPLASGSRDRSTRPPAAPTWFGTSLGTPSLVLRLRVFARRRTLDDQLATGADPSRSAALALRARQLVARPTRDSYAFALEALVTEAARAPEPVGMAIPLPRRQIMEARPALLGLAACLRAQRPVYARGMALLSSLLTDGAGPAFNAYAERALHDVLASAAEALDGRWPEAG
jgi:hypothetical protein